jgi:hypothetical protein
MHSGVKPFVCKKCGRAFSDLVPFTNTKYLTKERSLTSANNVEKPSFCWVTFKDIHELTGETNPLHVSNVEKPSIVPVSSKFMEELTLEGNLMCWLCGKGLHRCSTTCMNSQ